MLPVANHIYTHMYRYVCISVYICIYIYMYICVNKSVAIWLKQERGADCLRKEYEREQAHLGSEVLIAFARSMNVSKHTWTPMCYGVLQILCERPGALWRVLLQEVPLEMEEQLTLQEGTWRQVPAQGSPIRYSACTRRGTMGAAEPSWLQPCACSE